MKKAFTLSEALVTLAIIGVLAAILIPVINNVRPDKDRITYKKALYSLQSAVSNAMDSTEYTMASNSAAYWMDDGIDPDGFCRSIADTLNTAGRVNCTTSGHACADPTHSCYESPNFITNDGIRYWGLEGRFSSTNPVKTIYVDRKLTSGEVQKIGEGRDLLGRKGYGLKIQVRYDGKVGTDMATVENGDFNYENDLIEESLQVSAGKH